MPKFLIIRFSSIGDIVLTTPVIRCLKQQVPDAEVHFLTKSSFLPVVQHNPYIDKIHLLAHSWELMIEELKSENYDYIIDLHHNTKTLRVKSALKKKSFSFYKLNIEKYIYTSLKLNILPKVHIVDRYLKTVESFGVKNDGAGLDYFISKEEETKREDIPASHSAGFVACVIGAALGTKQWPVHKWKEFCLQLNHPVILLGGPEDVTAGNEIAAVDDIKVYNACGKFKLNESADLVRKAKLVVTNDTGLMHIAAAYKKPIISLWGNTVPSFGMTPYYGVSMVPHTMVQVNKLWCRPCSKIGYKKCPLGHFKCMEKIEVEQVIQIVKQSL
ncbi:MAG TPA: glycosyltransferase family 9 protein [Chitinophagaceae bacterium]|nr:glycosyltransferase family 9 protein [Chitinophagaceae bacterium]HRF17217.1 glycosyltransferase family 9 protein [Chitinophagaceae bacterium]